jgi:hypothetical protein
MLLKAEIKGLRNLYNDLNIHTKKAQRALQTAIKVEGFRRLKELREAVRSGDPGGRPYAHQLSRIARHTKSGALKKNQVPLYRLARLLRYNVEYRDGDIKFNFGFVTKTQASLSSSYKELLIKHQEGLDVLYKGSRTELGKRFARIGGKLKKKGDPDAKFFFLRKTTGRTIHLPERDIINPYYDDKRADMLRNIRHNFRLKMAGNRI